MSDCTDFLLNSVQSAVANRQKIIIQGGGTKQFLGAAIDPDAHIVSTLQHQGVVHYEPVELVMTARAGTTLTTIDAELQKNNQILACDPPRFGGKATIGGSLAANQSGPARPWAGSLRDHVLGVKLINGLGEHLNFGGRVMKNVAGFDVSRLQSGAMGCLGLITQVSFKVLPKPAATVTITQELTQQQAIDRMNKLAGQPKPLTGACWYNGILYLRLAGAENAVAATVQQWGGEFLAEADAEKFWCDLREQKLPFFSLNNKESLWRFSVNSAAPEFLSDESWLIDWGGSLRWLKGDFSHADLLPYAQQAAGEVICYRNNSDSQTVCYQSNAALQAIYKNIKQAFDPNSIFNPGRLYGWL